MKRVLVWLFILCCASAFTFELEAKKYRCFAEELPTGVEVVMSYAAAPGYAQFVDVKITDPLNKVIWEDVGNDKGTFKQAIAVGGDYAFCFYSRLVPGVRAAEGMHRLIHFNLKTGAETQNYREIASREHLKPMEVNLRMMEDVVRSIHGEYIYYKEREMAMRDTNEHMNARAMWATLVTMALIVGFAVWQVRHLKHYFRRKRMID